MERKNKSILCAMLLILTSLVFTACGVIEVRGKTFSYDSVKIDWGLATDEDKQLVYEEFLVSNEDELLNVLKTRNNRNKRITTFATDGTYTTINTEGEELDTGFYRQDNDIISLAETEDGFDDENVYKLKSNDKGYTVSDKINSEFNVFAIYQYVVKG